MLNERGNKYFKDMLLELLSFNAKLETFSFDKFMRIIYFAKAFYQNLFIRMHFIIILFFALSSDINTLFIIMCCNIRVFIPFYHGQSKFHVYERAYEIE